MQSCALDWVDCRNRYALQVNNPAWFMSLYKKTVFSTFNTNSIKDYRMRNLQLDPEDTTEYQAGPALALLTGASKELKAVLSMLADAPAEALACMFDAKTETSQNRLLLRLAQLPVSRNVVAELRELLTTDEAPLTAVLQ
jgi:hypothetical protein